MISTKKRGIIEKLVIDIAPSRAALIAAATTNFVLTTVCVCLEVDQQVSLPFIVMANLLVASYVK